MTLSPAWELIPSPRELLFLFFIFKFAPIGVIVHIAWVDSPKCRIPLCQALGEALPDGNALPTMGWSWELHEAKAAVYSGFSLF